MDDFIPGQRWISDAELQLGLGTVLTVEHRTVTVVYLASGETRTYAKQTAPLTRVVFSAGDTVRAAEGWSLHIEQIQEDKGLLAYVGQDEKGNPARLPEGQLDNLIQLNRPAERLFTGQFDHDKLFTLRRDTLQHVARQGRSDLRGLTGGRTSLIPHQLYIAHEVAGRYAPRVLLADEVGLGKTIEAGLILHQQLLTERAQRVLIVVPESLQHQWLVEMLRRFNLFFSLFDEERCLAIEESSGQDNPFQAEQLVLTSIAFLRDHPARYQQALAAGWDLLVVDEAHHLAWSPEAPSVEYQMIEQLAAVTKGVLLLTATPEQLGKLSHFARLRLLDPDRFPDFDQFVAEEAAYEPVAQAVEALMEQTPLDEAARDTLLATLNEGDNRAYLDTLNDPAATPEAQSTARLALVEHLLDRHGTGRVLYRNTRAAVQGFPARELHAYPLPLPEAYAEAITALQQSGISEPSLLLCPERIFQQLSDASSGWSRIDPRVAWLIEQLRSLRKEKVLVICASAETALDLADALREQSGIHAALFHEGMSLIERDRAAAYFADKEYGSPVLLCSEIGSEGRNFQFAHHLILFDLPLNPDLLEQRIGRLDRIGQTQTIRIHVPYLEQSAQEVMMQWYHDGLGAFEQTCPAGYSVYVQVQETLLEALHQVDEGLADLPNLIAVTQKLHQELNDALHRGRDRLLEYNSCRPHVAEALRDRALEVSSDDTLPDYLDTLFDSHGIDSEPHSEHCLIVRPSDHQHGHLPGLNEEGMTITYDRATALANEDIHFLTWEHPLVRSAMELVLGNERGNCALVATKLPGVQAGQLLLECLFVLESAGSESLQASHYLPPTTLRVVIDSQGKTRTDEPAFARISPAGEPIDAETAARIVRAYTEELRSMVKAGEQQAGKQAPTILQQAHAQTINTLQKEVDRLKALRRVNPNVREEEISFFEMQQNALVKAIDNAVPRLDALRVIVTT